jgi:hypothetical protein
MDYIQTADPDSWRSWSAADAADSWSFDQGDMASGMGESNDMVNNEPVVSPNYNDIYNGYANQNGKWRPTFGDSELGLFTKLGGLPTSFLTVEFLFISIYMNSNTLRFPMIWHSVAGPRHQ